MTSPLTADPAASALNPKRRCHCAEHDGREPWHGTRNGYMYHRCRCAGCRAAAAAYEADHPRDRRAGYAAYYAAHREERRADSLDYYYAHREERRAYAAEYNAEHREERRATYAAYNATHREERRAYEAAHREERRAYSAAYTAAHSQEILARRASYRIEHREELRADSVRRHAEWAVQVTAWLSDHPGFLAAWFEAEPEEKPDFYAIYAEANPSAVRMLRYRNANAYPALARLTVAGRPPLFGISGGLPRPAPWPGASSDILKMCWDSHAEGDVFSQALAAGYIGGTAALAVDHALCPACAASMDGFARTLDLSNLTVAAPWAGL